MYLIEKLFDKKEWKALSEQSPIDIAKELGFRKAMIVAWEFLFSNVRDDILQERSVPLLYAIRDVHRSEWESCWKHDVFLATACYLTLKYNERYEALRRAYVNTKNPPPRLLIELASCCDCPGPPPISYDEAISLLQRAIDMYPYIDAVSLLSAIYYLKDDETKKAYWSKELEELEKDGKGITSPSIDPSFLIEYNKEQHS